MGFAPAALGASRGPVRRPGELFRAFVFVVGLLAVLGGAALWLFSTLLTTPLILAGLWIWSWEFVWARRLLHRFRIWLTRLLRQVRRRPKRWTVVTALGILSGRGLVGASLSLGSSSHSCVPAHAFILDG